MVREIIILILSFCSIQLSYAQVADSTDMMITHISDAPIFKENVKDFIQSKIIYPPNAKRDSIEGTVIVSFWIDTLGNTFNHEIIKGIQNDMDIEALRVSKLIKFEKPAMQRNKPIVVKYTVPVGFHLSTQNIVNINNKCNSINNYIDLTAKFTNDTVKMGDELTLIVTFINKTDNCVEFYPNVLMAMSRVVGFSKPIYLLRENININRMYKFSPHGKYEISFRIKVTKPFFAKGLNRQFLEYFFGKFKGGYKVHNKLFGRLDSNEFCVFVE